MTPQIDSQQNYKLISLQESDGKTTMKFKRMFETCDPEDNAVQVNGLLCTDLANRFSLFTDVSFLPQVCKIECGARGRLEVGSFPMASPLRSGFSKSTAIDTFTCDLDELKTKYRVCGKTIICLLIVIIRILMIIFSSGRND